MQTHFLYPVAAAMLLMAPAARCELQHRYSFTSDASDSAGQAHGTLEGGAAIADGTVFLDGVDSYVSLPQGIIAGYSAVTIEAWATISANGAWTRIFDFGDTDPASGSGRNYLFVSPASGAADTRLVISDANPGYDHEEIVSASPTIDDGNPVHVAAVVDDTRGWMALYINGQLVASRSDLSIPLSAVATNHAYIGRSVYNPDPYLLGSIDEFRIHNEALPTHAIAASALAGPDALDYDPGAISALSLALPAELPAGASATPQLSATFSALGEIQLGPADVSLTSSAPEVIEITAGGLIIARNPGSATITAELEGRTDSVSVTVVAQPAILAHRYSFSEPADSFEVTDSVGGAHGIVYPSADGGNTVGLGTGSAVFPGGASYVEGAYIDLPDYLVSVMTNVTFELWATWRGPAGSSWQRFFDFGSSAKGDSPHNSGGGTTSIYLTPRSDAAVARFNAWAGVTPEAILTAPAALPLDREVHIVGIYAPGYGVSRLWVDGVLVSSGAAPHPLADFLDVNNWLGVSNWDDPPLNGEINEFRIYEGALSELEIALNRQAGPDELADPPGALESVALNAPTLLLGNPDASPARLLANFENVSEVDVTGLSGTTLISADPEVFSVGPGGGLLPVAAGAAELVARYRGLGATSLVEVVAPTAIELQIPSPLVAGAVASNLVLVATYPGTNVVVTAWPGAAYEVDDEEIATVSADGAILPVSVGVTTISATFAGLRAEGEVRVLASDAPEPVLVHRYSFDGAPGEVVVEDSVGDADGELINPGDTSAFTGTGRLRLSGGAWDGDPQGGYVNLPNGLISGLKSTTIEAWIRWNGPADSSWQRIFDFGRNSAVDGNGEPLEDMYQNEGLSYMFLSPRSGDNTYRFAIKEGNGPEQPIVEAAALPVGTDVHCAVVYDAHSGSVRLYRDGQRVATAPLTLPLSVVEDINVYLGRSQWTDPYFAGEYDEFRIYDGALSDGAIAASFAAGPDSLPDPATDRPRLEAQAGDGIIVISWPAEAGDFTLESTTDVVAGSWAPVPEVQGNSVTLPATDGPRFFRLRR